MWAGPCWFPSCATGRPVVGIIDFWDRPRGFCRPCCRRAEAEAYSVRYEPMEGVSKVPDPAEEADG
jgi:hypothetical protein